jgi:hypothetical protein
VEGDFKFLSELIRTGKLDDTEERLKSAIVSGMVLGGDFIKHPLIELVDENPLRVWPMTYKRRKSPTYIALCDAGR